MTARALGFLELLETRIAAVEQSNHDLAAEVAALKQERKEVGRWLTPAEVRAMKRVGQARLWKAIESGELPSQVRPGRGGKMCHLILAENARAWDPRASHDERRCG
ncbi:MAG TPA: hypothetical protein VEL07_19855 [Planctomycetota bacterium]|nr:hypothetical protein [Planctomycetota bacterium]